MVFQCILRGVCTLNTTTNSLRQIIKLLLEIDQKVIESRCTSIRASTTSWSNAFSVNLIRLVKPNRQTQETRVYSLSKTPESPSMNLFSITVRTTWVYQIQWLQAYQNWENQSNTKKWKEVAQQHIVKDDTISHVVSLKMRLKDLEKGFEYLMTHWQESWTQIEAMQQTSNMDSFISISNEGSKE